MLLCRSTLLHRFVREVYVQTVEGGGSCICFAAPLFCLYIVSPCSTLPLSYFIHIRIALRISVPLHEVRLREPSPAPSLHAQPGMPGHPKAPPSPESSGVNRYPSRRHQFVLRFIVLMWQSKCWSIAATCTLFTFV